MKDMEITLVFGQMKANQKHKKSAVFQNVLENHVKTGIFSVGLCSTEWFIHMFPSANVIGLCWF